MKNVKVAKKEDRTGVEWRNHYIMTACMNLMYIMKTYNNKIRLVHGKIIIFIHEDTFSTMLSILSLYV